MRSIYEKAVDNTKQRPYIDIEPNAARKEEANGK